MSIPEDAREVKREGKILDLLTIGSLVLSVVLGFGLGRLTGSVGNLTPKSNTGAVIETFYLERPQEREANSITSIKPQDTLKDTGTVYASKNGKRYYYEHCGGLKRIKPENLISFSTIAEAEGRGYTLASGCSPR